MGSTRSPAARPHVGSFARGLLGTQGLGSHRLDAQLMPRSAPKARKRDGEQSKHRGRLALAGTHLNPNICRYSPKDAFNPASFVFCTPICSLIWSKARNEPLDEKPALPPPPPRHSRCHHLPAHPPGTAGLLSPPPTGPVPIPEPIPIRAGPMPRGDVPRPIRPQHPHLLRRVSLGMGGGRGQVSLFLAPSERHFN